MGDGGGEKRILCKRHQFRSAFCLSASEIEKERKKCEGRIGIDGLLCVRVYVLCQLSERSRN